MNQSNVSHLSSFDRQPLSAPRSRPRTDSRHESSGADQRKKFVAKGHDGQLQDAQYAKHPVTIITMGDITYQGTISRRDKYTITLLVDRVGSSTEHAGKDVIIYKHAIESVMVTGKPADILVKE